MANLNKMYDGVVNSPETYLTQNLAADATIIYVADSSVFGSLPNLAVIGTDQNAETILITSKRSDGGLDISRAVEGIAKRWEKATVIARNFTNFDYQQIKKNIEKLNNEKAGTTDIKTKLSEMISDSTHRTVTDSEKATWNTVKNKVEKVTGKSLSTNDYTDAAKQKVDDIPYNPKYTDTVTSINGKTGKIVKADIVALGIPEKDTVTSINGKTGAISKNDIVALGIPSKDTTYSAATQSYTGLMSAADKKRLDNIREQVPLSEAQYKALSSVQQDDKTKIYFIRKS